MGDGRVRVLHVVATLDRAGTETWLMHVLRNIDRGRFQMDFLVHWEREFHYEAEARELGARVIRCLHPRVPWVYARNFQRVLREYGPYDVVHSHVHHFSGIVLKIAKQCGVAVRIVHSHQDSRVVDAQESWARKVYLNWSHGRLRSSATLGLAVSEAARRALFDDQSPFPVQNLYYSIHLTPFRQRLDRRVLRGELNIPDEAVVFGHVGRFVTQKNHEFLVEIAEELLKLEPRAWFLLVGDGPLRPGIESKFRDRHLGLRSTFTGVSNDVPRLMRAMDGFVFPSRHEGLGLVLIEAQAAALRCVLSDVVPEEADVIKPLINRLSLEQSASAWARTAWEAASGSRPVSPERAVALIEDSRFGPMKSIQALENVYCEAREAMAVCTAS